MRTVSPPPPKKKKNCEVVKNLGFTIALKFNLIHSAGYGLNRFHMDGRTDRLILV